MIQLVKKWNEAYNNHDAAAIGALYTEDAVHVTPDGFVYGRKAIENSLAEVFKSWQPKNHTSTIDPHSVRMLGPDNLTRSGEWSETGLGKNGEPISIKGCWACIYVREGDDWKIRMNAGNITPDSVLLINKSFAPQPAATPSPTASPSTP